MIKRQSLFELGYKCGRRILACTLCCCLSWPVACALAEENPGGGFLSWSEKSTLMDALENRSLTHRDSRCFVLVSYPRVGNARVDDDLSYWANISLQTFVSGVKSFKNTGNLRSSMLIDYETSRPSPGFLSVVFRLDIDTNGLIPDSGMVTFTYDLSDGRKLLLQDIFGDSEGVLGFFSSYSSEVLLDRLGYTMENSIRAGTAPDRLNFSMFALTPEGVVLFFPPDQVAPKSMGEQRVVIGLDQLAPYEPKHEIWKTSGQHSLSAKG